MASPEDALLKWINTFPLDAEVSSLADLSDGLTFAQMLEDISPDYAVKEAVNNTIPSKWLRKKKALEAIYRSLLRFLQNNTEYSPNQRDDPVDLDAIAENDDTVHIIQLASLFLIAAVLSGDENSNKYSTRMGDFDQDTIIKIQEIVSQQVANQTRSKSPSTDADEKLVPSPDIQDLNLALEEEHARLKVELAELKKKHADFITRFDVLDYSHEELKSRHTETEEELQNLKESQDDDDQGKTVVLNLQRQLQESNDLIATQEQQLNTNDTLRRQQKAELASLRSEGKRLTVLDDEVRELKTENATLARKANRADHFEKKIESLVSTQKENEKLKETNEVLIANMREWDQVHAELAKMQNSVERYQKMHTNQELDIVELERRIKIYQQETNKQKDELDELKAQRENEERFYAEKIEELTVGHQDIPESPTAVGVNKTLEQELDDDSPVVPNQSFEVSRLKAENQVLKNAAGGTVKLELEELERARNQLDDNLRKLTEEHIILQEHIKALVDGSDVEKDKTIGKLRTAHHEANQQLKDIQAQLQALRATLSEKERTLTEVQGDLAAHNQEEASQLEELKKAHDLNLSSLTNELRRLQERFSVVTVDLEQKSSHLADTILANHKLLSDGKLVTSPLDDEEARRNKKELETLQQHEKRQETAIADLQRRLRAAEEASPESQKATTDSILKNITRENALISTAWYDLTSRLQSNHVVLQRRQDAPKSWLNRQRQMVNSTPRR